MRFAIALAITAALGFAAPLPAFADSHEAKPAEEAPADVSAPSEEAGEKAAAEGEEKPAEGEAKEEGEAQPE
jgi:hypothetical protein